MQHDPFAALDELERRYDGPVPAELKRLLRAGSARALRRAEAEGRAAFFRDLAMGAVRALKLRRGADSDILAADLALYRRQHRRWRRLAALFARNAADELA